MSNPIGPTYEEITQGLVCVRELLSDPEHWTKGSYARNAKGLSVYSDSHDAQSFCLIGAASRCSTDHGVTGAVILRMQRACPIPILSRFNDDPRTTHADVLAVIDRAIEEPA